MKVEVGEKVSLDRGGRTYTKNTNEILVMVNKNTKEVKEIDKIERCITSF